MAAFTIIDAPITEPDKIAKSLTNPGFGQFFSDHMAIATWNPEQGWHDQQIVGSRTLNLHPGTAALHYGQEIFEGLKAYRHPDGSIWLFRPQRNAARFVRSAERMSMAPFPERDFLDACTTVTRLDAAWVPDPGQHGEQSMYLRPFMFASETLIGVRAAIEYTFIVLASPVPPFYADPLKLWVSPEFSRTAMGGTGEAKCGGNYAASMAGEREAHEHGCGQVLWLDSAERRWVEESGTMNFLMITTDHELVTPALTGTILNGVTRASLLELAPKHGLKPVERQISLDEVRHGLADGHITEVLACGTAAVISPVVAIHASDWREQVGDGHPGAQTLALREHLTNIQFGRGDMPAPQGWMLKVC